MRSILFVHILAGALALLSGYVALYAAKGGRLHRKSGMLFVYAMLAMCAGGFFISAVRGVAPQINIPAATLTAYLVVTSLTTVRPPARRERAVMIGGLLVALAVGLADLALAFQGGGAVFVYVMFATAALSGAAGDIRVLRSGPLQGARRLARHLWRMTFALFIAALSFFIGQAKVIPKPIRIPGLLAIPVLAVLVTMIYWLWRLRRRRGTASAAEIRLQEAA